MNKNIKAKEADLTVARNECIRSLRALINNIAKWPEGRQRVCRVIAEYNNWGSDEQAIIDADHFIKAAEQALDDLGKAQEDLTREIAALTNA